MKTMKQYTLGDMVLRYVTDEKMHMGLEMFPASMENQVKEKNAQVDSLIQWKKVGDAFPYGFANGITMRNSASVWGLKWNDQQTEKEGQETRIRTTLTDPEGNLFYHTVTYTEGREAVSVDVEIQNKSGSSFTIEMLSSFSLGGISVFAEDEGTGRLAVHKMRSKWSGEGRMEKRSAEELLLEPTWSRHGVYSDRFGQTGSLPVRGYFPFAAVEDTVSEVVWAAALEAPASWQMEVYRRDEGLCLSGGLPDFDYGHWCKELKPEESFRAPRAYLTVCRDTVDTACQRLSDLWKTQGEKKPLPIIFNEYCTTWGTPSHENIRKILKVLKGKPADIFVIDAGWYADPEKGWESNMGDWEISKELFPNGMQAVVNEIKENGLIPGIWFETETCGKDALMYQNQEHLLKRNGQVITSGGRRFWDMRDPWVIDYLEKKMIDFLEKYGFGYVKIDYNESIGIGCDGAESLGEGLRQSIRGTQGFFKKLRERLPGLLTEICASGGHRMEPSMLMLGDLVSFSDAHEEKEIPIIAANIQRLVPPEKSQIWAVLQKEDSIRRLVYSMINTCFGVMCISGDVFDLSEIQWEYVQKGMEFYRAVSHIIQDGRTFYYGTCQKSWRKPSGWQGVLRYTKDRKEALCIFHRFEADEDVRIDLKLEEGFAVEKIYEEGDHGVSCTHGRLVLKLEQDYEAVAVYLKNSKEI